MGSNVRQTKFRVLKIDRTVPYELVVIDDKVGGLIVFCDRPYTNKHHRSWL